MGLDNGVPGHEGIEGGVARRAFLFGAVSGVAGAIAVTGGRGVLASSKNDHAVPDDSRDPQARHAAHGDGSADIRFGQVDHEGNGFHPLELLTEFDEGHVSRDLHNRVVREYEFEVIPKRLEIAPGVHFDAWTYNGRVPGPTIRAVEGDRLQIRLTNTTDHPHTMHFHGIHAAAMDGIPGVGEVFPGDSFTYDFVAAPFGTHLYHCHSAPLSLHIHRGLYGAFIVDPKRGRPQANEMVMVMNAFDIDEDGVNDVYALNTVAFAYAQDPIAIERGQLQRAHVINMTEFDLINSLHLHGNFFHLYRTGTSMTPHEYTDVISMSQTERHMLEFTYTEPGRYMFHAHQSRFEERGWMSHFAVS